MARRQSVAVSLVTFVLLALSSAVARGQQAGSIAGLVRDTTGAVLPGVTVEVADAMRLVEQRLPYGYAASHPRSRRAFPVALEASEWAFGVAVLACPRCGERLRLVVLIEQASVIQRIVRHLGLPTVVTEA